MTYRIVFTQGARGDLLRLYDFLDQRDRAAGAKAREALRRSFEYLTDFPFNSRKATSNDPTMREIVIPFGRAGYVALFEVRDQKTVIVLAIRRQREADYFF